MVDTLTKKQRSQLMSRIRSKWTSQERRVHNYLKANKIKHKMHPKMEGSPDILLKETKTAVFLQGCFWHKCPKCYKTPKTHKDYWLPKIEKNVNRDRKNKTALKKKGFGVITIWEHQIKKEWNDVTKTLIKVASN